MSDLIFGNDEIPKTIGFSLKEKFFNDTKFNKELEEMMAATEKATLDQCNHYFSEKNMDRYVGEYFMEYADSIILNFLGLEKNWNKDEALSPTVKFEQSPMYKIFKDRYESHAKRILLEKFLPSLDSINFSEGELNSISELYKKYLKRYIEVEIHEKAKRDAKRIFELHLGIKLDND
jgi:hypothetical protein